KSHSPPCSGRPGRFRGALSVHLLSAHAPDGRVAAWPEENPPMKLPIVPASMFGIVLGVAGLGGAWRAAGPIWDLPPLVAESLIAIATIVWAILTTLFALKWIFARTEALSEARHPIQCCFIGLAGVSTMLIALGALPHSRDAAILLAIAGGIFTFGFGIWRT